MAYALVADVVTPEQRISAFGMQRMGTNLGWAIGPALGGVLTLVMPYGAVFFIAAVGILLAAFLTLGRLPLDQDGTLIRATHKARTGIGLS